MKTCPYSFGDRKALLAVFALSLCLRAFAVNLLVYNHNDSGPGSLRQAVIDNNASAGGNGITFSNTVTGTITLTNGELLISRHVVIEGPGAGVLALSGNGSNRLFHIQVTNDAAVLIRGLTITNGVSAANYPAGGGAIWNDHSILRVDSCTFSGNASAFGGAICNDGSYSNSASVLMENCTFSNNSGGVYGGALNNIAYQGSAGMVAKACTFIGNSAFGGGGAIYNDAYQGYATVTVNACTLSSNQVTASFIGSGGAAIYNHGLAGAGGIYVSACTFNGNSATNSDSGIYLNAPSGSATMNIGNTILRAGGSGVTILNNFGVVTSHGYNLSSDNGGGVLTNATDLHNIDPLLGPLADNGGPTFTHALLPGSSAIDKGKRDAVSFIALLVDQRGAPRPFDFASITNAPGGDGSDIGAFELASPLLNIQRVGNGAVLSWPSGYGDFILQFSTNVSSSNSWITAPGPVVIVSSQYQQTNGPISTNRFFRLIRN